MNFLEFSSFPTQKDNLRKSLFPFSLIKLKTKNINSLNTSFVSYQQKILGKTAELLNVNNKHNINNTNLFEIYQLNNHQTKKRKKTLIPCYTKKIKSKSAIEVPIINNNNNTSFQELKSPVYWKNKKQSTNSLPDTTLNNYYSTNMTTHMSLIGKSKSCIDQTIGYTFPKEKSSRETLTINASKTRKNIFKKNKIPVKKNSLVNSLSQKYKKLLKNADLSIIKSERIGSMINFEKNNEIKKNYKKIQPEPNEYLEIITLEKAKLKECKQNLINVKEPKTNTTLVLQQGNAKLMNYCDIYNKLDDNLFYFYRKKVEDDYSTIRREADIEVKEEDDTNEQRDLKYEQFMSTQLKIKKIALNLNRKKLNLISKINSYTSLNRTINSSELN